MCRIARFREKPTPDAAAGCLARGWLWNTFVMVARAATLMSVSEVLLPALHRRFSDAARVFGTVREQSAIRQAYADHPRHNFSEVVLQAGLPFLGVSALPPLTWSDLGTPQRLFSLMRLLRITPGWIGERRGALRGAWRAS